MFHFFEKPFSLILNRLLKRVRKALADPSTVADLQEKVKVPLDLLPPATFFPSTFVFRALKQLLLERDLVLLSKQFKVKLFPVKCFGIWTSSLLKSHAS
jgi:hypothetical protein